MKSYEAGADIKAQPAIVWAILTDAGRYTEWDSGVARVEGTISLGAKIKVYSELSPDRAFPVKVAELVPNQMMSWRGGMPFGLFKGLRTFRLQETPEGTRFDMREVFSGPLLPLIGRSMPDLGPSFQQFTDGLKATAEGS